MTTDTANEGGYKLKIISGTVLEETLAFVERLKKSKKKTIPVEHVLRFFDVAYYNKQTVEVYIDNYPVKFEGFNEEQVEYFMKIFEGYKYFVEHTTNNDAVIEVHEDLK